MLSSYKLEYQSTRCVSFSFPTTRPQLACLPSPSLVLRCTPPLRLEPLPPTFFLSDSPTAESLKLFTEPLQDNDPMCWESWTWSRRRKETAVFFFFSSELWFFFKNRFLNFFFIPHELTFHRWNPLYFFFFSFFFFFLTTTQYFIFSLWFPTLPRVTLAAHREGNTGLFHSAVGSVCGRRESDINIFSSQEKNKTKGGSWRPHSETVKVSVPFIKVWHWHYTLTFGKTK